MIKKILTASGFILAVVAGIFASQLASASSGDPVYAEPPTAPIVLNATKRTALRTALNATFANITPANIESAECQKADRPKANGEGSEFVWSCFNIEEIAPTDREYMKKWKERRLGKTINNDLAQQSDPVTLTEAQAMTTWDSALNTIFGSESTSMWWFGFKRDTKGDKTRIVGSYNPLVTKSPAQFRTAADAGQVWHYIGEVQ